MPPWWRSHGQEQGGRIPPCSCEPPDVGLTWHLEYNHHKQRAVNVFAYELCMCKGTGLNLNPLFVAQNGIVLELTEPQVAKTATLASYRQTGWKGLLYN